MRLLLDHAAENDYGLAAFNVNNMEQIQAIMEAAQETDSPVIVQASRGARSYSQDNYLRHLMLAAAELYPRDSDRHAPGPRQQPGHLQERDRQRLHLRDDGRLAQGRRQDAGRLRLQRRGHQGSRASWPTPRASRSKASSAASARSNRATAKRKTATAPKACLSHDQLLTDPDEAERFVAETGVDALAVAIGTSHGAYKFTKKPTGEVLAMDRIEEIHRRLPNCHLVMHGSSSVPQDLQDIINKYGGKLKQTWGVPVEEIQRGIKHGVRKINVDTDNRLAITGAIRKVFAESPEKFDPRDYLKPARDAMKKVCVARMTAFGQAGWGSQDQAGLDRQVRQLLRDGVGIRRTCSRDIIAA